MPERPVFPSLPRCLAGLIAMCLVVPCAPKANAQIGEDPIEPPSPRNANYTIEVELDPEAKLLTATSLIRWRNLRAIDTNELRLHVYWNAWRNNRSSWLLESRLRPRGRDRDSPSEGDYGYSDVRSIRLIPDVSLEPVDLTASARYEAPDDGNPDDRTLLVVPLPEPVTPDEMVLLQIEWVAKIPRTFARTGFRGNFFFIAQWFPKIAVLEAGGWNAHQFHAGTEFYSDYGEYDVRITVPSEFAVGATGLEIESDRVVTDGKTTYRFRQDDVHDFAWTASPDFLVLEESFDEAGLAPVAMRLLLQPEHEDQADRHFEATRAALRSYGTWYGPYPYEQITIVDPAYGSGAGGMEYPTLFTAGTRLFNPFGGGSPEGVTIHEAGHQFWYGVVGNNEFEHAWLDEGFNTFSTARAMDVTYGDRFFVKRYLNPRGTTSLRGFLPFSFDEVRIDRMVGGNRLDGYRLAATSDAQSTPTYLYFPATGGAHSYNKTALWLSTLERYLGWEVLKEILSTFYQRFAFRHPSPEDFFSVANEVSGQDLSWFFQQVYDSSEAFDYGVSFVRSDPIVIRGYAETRDGLEHSEEQRDGFYRTEVVARRYGGATFPVEVSMVFDDGVEVRKSWDGLSRWKLFVEEREAKLLYAVVDRERILLLDIDYTNNSRLLEPRPTLPARKWGSTWMVWLQDLLLMLSLFA